MKIVFLENIGLNFNQKNKLKKYGDLKYYNKSSLAESKVRVKDADVVIIDWIEPNEFLVDMKKGSLLALMSTGYSWVDTKKAKELGITVTNIPGYATEAVAEFLIGGMIMLARKIDIASNNLKNGKWLKESLKGFELKDKTLGIIGLGQIGSRVKEIAKTLGMDILAYDLDRKKAQTDLNDLLQKSDVICVTPSVNDRSKGMLDLKELDLMKKNAIVVGSTWEPFNVDVLTQKLSDKAIAGVFIDVAYEGKQPELPKELLKLDNVILTPHIAFNTEESEKRRVEICLDNIISFIKGRSKNIVN